MSKSTLSSPISSIISKEINCLPKQVVSAIVLLDEGSLQPI